MAVLTLLLCLLTIAALVFVLYIRWSFTFQRPSAQWVEYCSKSNMPDGITTLQGGLRDMDRVLVVGSTSSGKTTLAARLANMTKKTHVELDNLYHKPGWGSSSHEEMRCKVKRAISSCGHTGFTTCGNYRCVRDILCDHSTVVIWLDYSLLVNLIRLLSRTTSRWWKQEIICNGNVENLWDQVNPFAPEKSLFYHLLGFHWEKRRRYSSAFQVGTFPLGRHDKDGFYKLKHHIVLRFRSPAETEKYLSDVAKAVCDVKQEQKQG
eukprot:jgi/Bigna1/91470/estExt_fgenesh1_pg.C_1020017